MASLFTGSKFSATNANGAPLAGGRVYTYFAGTLNKQATYTDQGGLSANENPVILDASGRANIWLGAGAYRFIIKDASDVLAPDGDTDNITLGTNIAESLADTASAANGDAMVGVKRAEANAVGRTLHFYIQHSKLLVANYCDPTADTPSQIASAIANAIADAKAGGKVLEFDPGATYSADSEFAFCAGSGLKGLRYWGNGATLYRSSGAGPVASLDALSNTIPNYDVELIDFRLRGNAASTYGLYTRALSGSRVENIRAIDVATAGFKVDWSVCTKFKDLAMSTNHDTFAVTATKGLIVDQSTPGNYTADCLFENMRFEGSCITDVGIELMYADLNNVFRGGTCEGMPRGFRTLSTSGRNTVTEMDFEANTDYDISIGGNGLVLQDVNASSAGATGTTIVGATAQNTTFRGGYQRWVAHNPTSLATRFYGTKISDAGSIGITGVTGGSVPAAGIVETFGVVRVNGSLVPTSNFPDGFTGPTTWTPAFASAGGGVQGAVTSAVGNSCLTGRLCLVQGLLSIAKGTLGAGAVSVTGLPFTSRATANDFQYIPVEEWDNVTLGAGYTTLTLRIAPGAASASLLKSGTAVVSAVVNVADFPDPMGLRFSGVYEIG